MDYKVFLSSQEDIYTYKRRRYQILV